MGITKNIQLSEIRSIHFVGIKGIAMAALAVWAHQKGIRITGSDISETFPSDPILHAIGVTVLDGFDPTHIKHPDLVIYTGAHNGHGNVEVVEAIRKGIPVLPHGKALGLAMHGKEQISVAGSHGKTTTSAMIAVILMGAQSDPSYAIGCGEIRGLGLPGHSGQGRHFVAEADEYITDPTHDPTPRFLWQYPDILVVTNVDYDHPDAYASLGEVQQAFSRLMKQQTGIKLAVLNYDDKQTIPLITGNTASTVVTYGLSPGADYRAEHITYHAGQTSFALYYRGQSVGNFIIKVPGAHNVSNAMAAAIACRACGLSWKHIREGLGKFEGAKRRFELLSDEGGISFYDDYAHHPREIAATLSAVRSWYPKHRIIVVFQPHTYSRTKSLLSDFSACFGDCDIVIPCEIYASAREKETLGMTGLLLASEIQKNHPQVIFAPDKEAVLRILSETIKKGDKVIFMGAGDIYTWEKHVLNKLHNIKYENS